MFVVRFCSQVLSASESLKRSSQVVLVPERRLRTVITRESLRKPGLAGMSKKDLNQDLKTYGVGQTPWVPER